MKDEANTNAPRWRPGQKQSEPGSTAGWPGDRLPGPVPSPIQTNGHTKKPGIDAWFVLDMLLRRWHWLLLGTFICGGLFAILGSHVIRPKFTAAAQLLRYEIPGKSEYFKTPPISGDTLAALIRSPDVLRDVAQQVVPAVSPETFGKWIKIDPDPDSDIVKIYLAARNPRQAVDWLNLYITNAVEHTRQQEARQLQAIADNYLKKEVEEITRDVTEVESQFFNVRPTGTPSTNNYGQVNARLSAVNERLQKALTELDDLKTKYTDIHPKVQAQQEAIDALRKEVTDAGTNRSLASMAMPVSAKSSDGALNPELDLLHIKMRALEDGKMELLKRQREAELYATNAPGSLRVLAPATIEGLKTNLRQVKIAVATIFGGGLGFVGMLFLVLLIEFLDTRLKTAEDVSRVTHLPILASLGDLHQMQTQERAQWAFRAWTMLQGKLSPSPNHGLICGITSSASGEGRSTWISLLAEAASLTGFRVLTIATRPSPTHLESGDALLEEPPPEDLDSYEPHANGSKALTSTVLTCPSQVTEQLTGPNSQPVVHIPLPGWVWNLERRKQWRDALNHWRQIDNLVILVELPPAEIPEAVLLGSHLPNLIWLADSDFARAASTRANIQTLQDARCNLVGAVINRQTGVSLKNKFPRWLTCALVLLALETLTPGKAEPLFTPDLVATKASPAPAAEAPVAASETPLEEPSSNGFFSIVGPEQKAPWQRHLTLGPGDVLSFHLYGAPELALTDAAVGPDGRVNYLEATNVLAAGLTVDELRARMDQELAKFRRAPHTIITPVAYKSKKYYVLGKVATKGVFILDRPVTVLEALARAHGLESALVDRHLVELTDFQRSFLAREGKRYPLNFEQLFQRGDLSQNIGIQPGDYLYFAPGDVQQVYVVGEVRLPGTVTYTPNLTIVSAIAQRGGFTDRAFKARVLVVRGPLSAPTRFVANTHAVLDAVQPDTLLQPRDIIYVNSRPFIKVEEAADLAATAFIQSIITSWVGVDVVKPINP